MKKYFQIKEGVIWRRETGCLMLLHPMTKKLFFFNKAISDKFSNEGIIEIKRHSQSPGHLINSQIVRSITKPAYKLDYKNNRISAPLNVTIQLTGKCNLTCAHCHRNSKKVKDFNFNKLIRLVEMLREMKVFNINLSGGEPLLYTGLLKIINRINSLGMKVTMSTNGLLLDAEKIKAIRLG